MKTFNNLRSASFVLKRTYMQCHDIPVSSLHYFGDLELAIAIIRADMSMLAFILWTRFSYKVDAMCVDDMLLQVASTSTVVLIYISYPGIFQS